MPQEAENDNFSEYALIQKQTQRILMPLYERLKANPLTSAKLAVDETPVSGRGQDQDRLLLDDRAR